MARDYAKKSGSSKRGSTRRKKNAGSGGNGLKLYLAGVLSGVFLSALVYLSSLTPEAAPPPPPPQTPAAPVQPDAIADAPKPRFDFYKLLPEQTIDVEVDEVEPARDVGKPGAADLYVLQAGSFRQREDADRRRAQLLLLGLEPTVEASSGDNGRWFRVYLGPFASRSDMNRVRGLTAGQDIDTLPLKRSGD